MATDDSTRKPCDPEVQALVDRLKAHGERIHNLAWTNLRHDIDQARGVIETLSDGDPVGNVFVALTRAAWRT